MIWVPRPRDFPELELPHTSRVSGWFKFEALKVDSNGQVIEKSRRVLADWFPNIILNQGLNRHGTQNANIGACQVGTGTSAPVATQTSLDAFLAGTVNINSSVDTAQPTSPYFKARTVVYRFNAGTATGTISEVGVGWDPTASASLYSRALILDGGGAPTSITILADEVLDVTYQLRLYYSELDATYNATITGVGTLTVTARPALITSPLLWNGGLAGITTTASSGVAYNGTLGPITDLPSGTSSPSSNASLGSYSSGSYQLSGTVQYGLNNGNLVGGIKSITQGFGASFTWGVMQYEFSSVINKLSTQVLTLNFLHSWSRRP
jgi:hypothetical protein